MSEDKGFKSLRKLRASLLTIRFIGDSKGKDYLGGYLSQGLSEISNYLTHSITNVDMKQMQHEDQQREKSMAGSIKRHGTPKMCHDKSKLIRQVKAALYRISL